MRPGTAESCGFGPLVSPFGLPGSERQLWDVGSLFFGLWLIPMGVLAPRSGLLRALSIILVAGGVGYTGSGFVAHLAPTAAPVAEVLPFLATIGEVWTIGLLSHTRAAR
ncbi:DUF4386 domain-containing protein [Promicromonospora soli]